MQRKSAKLLSELSRMKILGGLIKENYDDTDWGEVATERRKEAVGKIENEFGPQNQYSGSADWGGIPVWSVLGSEFEGYFIIDDSEFQPDKAFSLMKRTFNPDTEENEDEILFTAFLTPERYNEIGDGSIDDLIEKAKEIKSQNLKEIVFGKPTSTNRFRDKRKEEEKAKAEKAKAEKAKEIKTQNLNEVKDISINTKLSSKQGIKNAIYKVLEIDKVEGRYRDENWNGVSKFTNSLKEVGAEVDLLRSNYEGHGEVIGHESMPTRKVFIFEVSVRDKKGNVVTIPFKVTCAFVGKTGTMSDDVYELTYSAMA
jgi:hypothetical protein